MTISTVLFAASLAFLVVALFIFVTQENQNTKNLISETKMVNDKNQSLVQEWGKIVSAYNNVAEAAEKRNEEFLILKERLDKIEFAFMHQKQAVHSAPLPQKVEFVMTQKEPFKVVFKKAVARKKVPVTLHANPPPVDDRVINNIKKKLKEMNQ